MNRSLSFCCVILMLACGSAARAATFCAKTGNELNQALYTAGGNGQDDTIKVATGTHTTDYHAPGKIINGISSRPSERITPTA